MSDFSDSMQGDIMSLESNSVHRPETASFENSMHRLLQRTRKHHKEEDSFVSLGNDSFTQLLPLGDICECPRANMEKNNQALSKWDPEARSDSRLLPPASTMRSTSLHSSDMPPQEEIKMTEATGNTSFSTYFGEAALDTPVKSPTRMLSVHERKDIYDENDDDDFSIHLEATSAESQEEDVSTKQQLEEIATVPRLNASSSSRWDDAPLGLQEGYSLQKQLSERRFEIDTLAPLPPQDTPIRVPRRARSKGTPIDIDATAEGSGAASEVSSLSTVTTAPRSPSMKMGPAPFPHSPMQRRLQKMASQVGNSLANGLKMPRRKRSNQGRPRENYTTTMVPPQRQPSVDTDDSISSCSSTCSPTGSGVDDDARLSAKTNNNNTTSTTKSPRSVLLMLATRAEGASQRRLDIMLQAAQEEISITKK
jgi:hypothetical protein